MKSNKTNIVNKITSTLQQIIKPNIILEKKGTLINLHPQLHNPIVTGQVNENNPNNHQYPNIKSQHGTMTKQKPSIQTYSAL